MLNLLELIKVNKDFPKENIKFGNIGTVVEILQHDNQIAYEVEFCATNGKTIALLTLTDEDFI